MTAKKPYWNHRVIEFVEPDGGPWLSIHEVYYDADGNPQTYTENAIGACGDSMEELTQTLQRMMACLSKPVMKETDFSVGSDAKEGW